MDTIANEFLGYSIFKGQLVEVLHKGKSVINTINQYSFCLAEKDRTFKNALMDSDVLLPDGISIVLSAKFLNGNNLNKIAGADLHVFILNYLNSVYGSCFYLGSKEDTLLKIRERISELYPNVSCESLSPPFKDEFSNDENEFMIKKINEFAPDVLFVGMTAPKQEKWVHLNKDKINATYICSIGAVFDFFSGNIHRPSNFWVNHGLEWLVRFIKEPKRLWRRYFLYGGVYLSHILNSKVSKSVGFKYN